MVGYWQTLLAKDVQHLTTFITPGGCYCFKQSSMGFVSSGDEFCCHGDIAFSGIDNCVKVIDDILVWNSIVNIFKEFTQSLPGAGNMALQSMLTSSSSLRRKSSTVASTCLTWEA